MKTTYILCNLQCLVPLSFSLCECLFCDLSFFLKFGLVVSSHEDILSSHVNHEHEPFEEFGESNRVLIDQLWLHLQALHIAFEELQLLVEGVGVRVFGSQGVVLSKTFEEVVVKEVFGFFPFKFVGVTLTELLSLVTEEVKDGLEDARHLDHMILGKS